ncbi:hypothetical protein [Actinomadura sp. 3N407]|uniref:hypothetical protein n=1 Tax=Actinomadura sp. 3N407 TaxID=3457423 RepID=UPI003FCC5AE5
MDTKDSGETGGTLRWSPDDGALELCDKDSDDLHAMAIIIKGYTVENWEDEPKSNRQQRPFIVRGDGNCATRRVHIDSKTPYRFVVCLLKEGDDKARDCNGIESGIWLLTRDGVDGIHKRITWSPSRSLETTDSHGGGDSSWTDWTDGHGGRLHWRASDGLLQTCDMAADNYYAQADVSLTANDFSKSATIHTVTKRKRNQCLYTLIPDYGNIKDKTIYFRICIREEGGPLKYCRQTTSVKWLAAGAGVVKPPSPRPSLPIDARPDEELPGHVAAPPGIAQPLKILTGFLIWFVWAAFIGGFIIVGANMAIKHKRGEAGAHATGLGWVMVACVIGAPTVAIGFVALIF